MIPINEYRTKLKGLLEKQDACKSAINNNPKIKWIKRGTWTASLAWAAFLIVQSVPYYQAIAAGDADYKVGNYDSAELHFQNAVKQTTSYGATDLRKAKAWNNLAEIYRAKYQLTDAELLYKKSELLTQSLPANRPEIPMAMHNLASVYRDEGRLDESEQLERQALTRFDKYNKAPDMKRASILNGLGKTLRDKGKYAESERTYTEALKIQMHFLGSNDSENAGVYANLGGIRRDLGDFLGATRYYKQALTLDREALGATHPYVGTDLNNLGCLYRDAKKYAEAKTSFDDALAIRRLSFGPNSPLVAKTQLGLAELAIRQHKYREAQALLLQVQRTHSLTLPANHPDRAVFYNLMGEVYLAQGAAQKAYDYENRCLQIRERVTGATHADYAVALADRACAERVLADTISFEKDSARAKKILKDTIGTQCPVSDRVFEALRKANSTKS
ncbi:MAG TPA: tetratricopeptide repeat protein [Drouetiella sp.]